MFRNKLYSYINQNPSVIEHFDFGAPFKKNIIERSAGLINMGFDNSIDIESNKDSENTSNYKAKSDTDNVTINDTDNSYKSEKKIKIDQDIDNSQDTTNMTNMDTSSKVDVNSEANTYNVDASTVVNKVEQNFSDVLQQSCGDMLSVEEVEQVNITIDESQKTIIDAQNVFTNTADNANISDVKMKTKLKYLGSDIKANCVLNAKKTHDSQMKADNKANKDFQGGKIGGIDLSTGGNKMGTKNITGKEDEADMGADVGDTVFMSPETINKNKNKTKNANDLEIIQKTKQKDKINAGGGGGGGGGGMGGGMGGAMSGAGDIAGILGNSGLANKENSEQLNNFADSTKKKSNTVVKIIGLLVLLAMLGGGVYLIIKSKSKE